MPQKRRIAIIVGSRSDLPQCLKGLMYLRELAKAGYIEFVVFHVASIHRNTKRVEEILTNLIGKVDVIGVSAGWANHLSGTCDAYLRNTLEDDKIVVFAGAFQDKANPEHTQAAVMSIKHVPDSQVVFKDYIGEDGFLRMCMGMFEMDPLPKIKLPKARFAMEMTLDRAIEEAEEMVKEKGGEVR